MRVLNCMFSEGSGGLEKSAVNYFFYMQKIGVDVQMLVKKESDAFKVLKCSNSNSQQKNIHALSAFDTCSIAKNLMSKRLQDFIEHHKIDVVIMHGTRAIKLLTMAAKRTKAVTVAVAHSEFGYNVCFKADFIFALNSNAVKYFVQNGFNKKNVFLVKNGVEPLSKASEVSELKRDAKVIVLGSIGRLNEIKGYADLIKTFAKAQAASTLQLHLKIAGDGPQRAELQSIIASLNLKDKVELVGWVQNTQDFLKDIDIYCCSSKTETFGMSALEAMLCGKPVITSQVDGVVEIINNANCGIVVNIADADMFISAVAEILSAYEAFSANAKMRAMQYQWENVLSDIVEILKVISKPQL